MQFKLLANTPMGIERVVADEIEALGYETRLENGRVYFEGDETAIIRTNLMMRTADRIRIIIGDFSVETFDELFEKTKALPWSDILGPAAGISRHGTLPQVDALQRAGCPEDRKEGHRRASEGRLQHQDEAAGDRAAL